MSETQEATLFDTRKPWAFIAHRDGRWHGLFSAALPADELHEQIGRCVAEGSSIITVYDRAEYDRELANLKMWGEPDGEERKT
jgi:hypothetical protein